MIIQKRLISNQNKQQVLFFMKIDLGKHYTYDH